MSSFYCCFIPIYKNIKEEELIDESCCCCCFFDIIEHKYSKRDKIYTHNKFLFIWCCCFERDTVYYNFNTSELIITKTILCCKKQYNDNKAIKILSENNNYFDTLKYIKNNNKLNVDNKIYLNDLL